MSETGSDRDERGKFAAGNRIGRGHGRPPGSKSLTDSLARQLQGPFGADVLDSMIEAYEVPDSLAAELRELPNRLDALALIKIWQAARGNLMAFQEIFDRLAPKPRRTEISGPGGGPVRQLSLVKDLSEAEAEELYRRAMAGDEIVPAEEDEDEPE